MQNSGYSIQDLKGYSDPLKPAFLEAWPSLMIDTRFYDDDAEFVDTLLVTQKDLEESSVGLLVHSENFQALRLLLPRFREQVRCIYIDPPYNTSSSSIPYKNNYRHSSWATLMRDRLAALREYLDKKGVVFVSIDTAERARLEFALDSVFGSDGRIEELVWTQNTANSQLPTYSTNHEYVEVYARDRLAVEKDPLMFRELKPGCVEVLQLVSTLNHASAGFIRPPSGGCIAPQAFPPVG